jgi:hypothetical protein
MLGHVERHLCEPVDGGLTGASFRGCEVHYSTVTHQGAAKPLLGDGRSDEALHQGSFVKNREAVAAAGKTRRLK